MAVYPLYVAATPYAAEELNDLDYAQSFDTMFLTHIYYPPAQLVRNDHDDWLHSEIAFGPVIDAPSSLSAIATVPNVDDENDGDSYFPQEYNYIVSAVNEDGQESRGSVSVSATNDTELSRNYTTISWSAPAGDVDYYRVYKAHETGSFGFIGETTETSFKDDGYQSEYSDAPIEAFNPFDGVGEYPSRVAFWEQRLWFGNTSNSPNGAFATRSADFRNMDFARPQRENDSISISIATGQTNAISAFIPMDRLVVGTSDNIFSLFGPNDGILTPNPPPGARRQIGRGVSLPKPIVAGEVSFYQPHTETGVRTIGYSFEIDGYRSTDITIFASHLFDQNRIVNWSYQASPHSIFWVVRDDGKLLSFTWEAEQQVWGWCEHDLSGSVLDVVCIPEGDESRVYLTVEREINGETVRYVERLQAMRWTDYKLTSFLDCSRKYEFENPVTSVDGLAHLEGEAVTILADGFTTTSIVENGAITLQEPASKIIVGLPFDAVIETLDLVKEEKKKITGEIFLELVDSFDVYAGRKEDELELVRTRETDEIGPPILYTGQPEPARPDQYVDHQASIIVKQSTPYPFALTALHYGVEVKGRG